MTEATVQVDMTPRGAWQVTEPDRQDVVVCETLADAKRLGQARAQSRRPCQLVVRDAYHRVLVRELINGRGDSKL